MLDEKINRLEIAYDIETDVSVKVKLKHEIKEAKERRDDVKKQLDKIEKELSPDERKQIPKSKSVIRTKVFISYSHEDEQWLEKLQIYLKPLEKRGLVERWDDTQIKAGMKWRDEIKKALNETKIAILLVSSNFFASDFITDNELPPLLKAAEEEGALILQIILDPCKTAFFDSELAQFQAVNSPDTPLSGMSEHNKGEVFDTLIDRILDILKDND